MDNKQLTNTTYKLTISAMVIALYCVIMYFTQEISFGAYQIRFATALYALAYLFPFLVLPLGLANFLSNLLGGMGLIDMVGGCIVGCLTALIIVAIKKSKVSPYFCCIPIILVPGFGVAIWLSGIVNMPYLVLSLNLCIGQTIPSILGVILIKALQRRQITARI